MDLDKVSKSDVTSFIIGNGTRGASCARGLSGAIRCFLRYRQLIGDDVTHLLAGLPRPPGPKPSTLPDVLTGVELDALLQSFSADFPQRRRALAIARCLIDLGMRSSEVSGLTFEDVDWQRGTIRATHRKGRRADVMPLLEATGHAIADYILHERPAPACPNVFVRHRPPIGEPVGRRAVQRTMLAAYLRLDWDRTRVHILRHTLATRLLARGTPMPVIADVMGHRSLDTTVTSANKRPSPRHTIAAYRDTFQLLLQFAQVAIRKAPTDLTMGDINAALILGFLDHLEKVRGNSVRSRNARLASIRAFLKYAAHHEFALNKAFTLQLRPDIRGLAGFRCP